MKKITLSLVLALAVPGIHSAMANTGTITFNGEVTSNTCNVSVDGGTASETVLLPSVSASTLDGAGKFTGRTQFNMGLSGCTGTLQTASAYFEAGAGVNSDGRLINTGSAKNVDLQLRDGSNADAVIKAGSSSQVNGTKYVTLESGAANLPYSAEYYATDAAEAGTVVSSVVYSIQYK
ncbi:type 1 fimbrial protein (plasmid) [Klebsiella aerogenes]|uniref:fimbrial protein n=1 Tax=Klebsiella aerogenes TaxID=548 RepID=UPI00124F7384|nr:fimbrial protein [Klebsiella aerogenes]QFI19944.1 type 1 fimbrial protein [Klebsiella aerogenes]